MTRIDRTEFVEVERAGVVHQFGDIQRNVGTATAQPDQAHRRELLFGAVLVVALDQFWLREHDVTQTVEVIENSVGVGLGEVQVLLSRQWLLA